jgi:hypothetical protein
MTDIPKPPLNSSPKPAIPGFEAKGGESSEIDFDDIRPDFESDPYVGGRIGSVRKMRNAAGRSEVGTPRGKMVRSDSVDKSFANV